MTVFTATIETETMIAASPEEVWAVLTDFDAYPNWNPFICRIEGSAVVGRRLRTELTQSPDAKPMRFSPRVLAAEPARTLRWLGHVIMPGLLDGEHGFHLRAAPGGYTRFQQNERFSGVLVPFVRTKLQTETASSFKAMNNALKSRVETLVNNLPTSASLHGVERT